MARYQILGHINDDRFIAELEGESEFAVSQRAVGNYGVRHIFGVMDEDGTYLLYPEARSVYQLIIEEIKLIS